MNIDVNGQDVRVGHDILPLAWGYVDILLPETQHGRRESWSARREIEADRRLHALGSARRTQVQLKYHVGARVQTPRKILGGWRQLPGRPAKEVAFWIL